MKDYTIKCPCCNGEFQDYESFGNHLRNNHFLEFSNLYEILQRDKTERETNLVLNNTEFKYSVPDPELYEDLDKYQKDIYTRTTLSAISDYYEKSVKGDRFLQLFLIDPIYQESTLTHDFVEFKRVLQSLKNLDRTKIGFLDFVQGYPKIITDSNIQGLRMVDIDNYYKLENLDSEICLNDYHIKYPEIVPFDIRHYYRYNILNTSGATRQTSRLRLCDQSGKKSDKCIKFYGKSDVKSIFELLGKNGAEPDSISYQDLVVLKLVLLRNKKFLNVIFDVILSILPNIGIFRDSVFLKNTVTINPGNKNNLNITWIPEYKEDFINISIL